MTKKITPRLQFVVLAAMLTACNLPGTDVIPGAPALTSTPIASPTPEPTPTEIIPLVALVNGQGIRQISFDLSLAESRPPKRNLVICLNRNRLPSSVSWMPSSTGICSPKQPAPMDIWLTKIWWLSASRSLLKRPAEQTR